MLKDPSIMPIFFDFFLSFTGIIFFFVFSFRWLFIPVCFSLDCTNVSFPLQWKYINKICIIRGIDWATNSSTKYGCSSYMLGNAIFILFQSQKAYLHTNLLYASEMKIPVKIQEKWALFRAQLKPSIPLACNFLFHIYIYFLVTHNFIVTIVV